jgi:hypothetical protein
MTKIRNINVSGTSKIGCYAGPVEYGRGGSRKSPDSFSGASPPVSLNSVTITKSKLSLPVLVLLSGLAIGACDTATGSDRITPVNPGDPLSQGCGNPTACNEKTRQSLNRVLAEKDSFSTEISYIDGLNYSRNQRRGQALHSEGSTDYWVKYTYPNSGNSDHCYNDVDRQAAENYARERMYER